MNKNYCRRCRWTVNVNAPSIEHGQGVRCGRGGADGNSREGVEKHAVAGQAVHEGGTLVVDCKHRHLPVSVLQEVGCDGADNCIDTERTSKIRRKATTETRGDERRRKEAGSRRTNLLHARHEKDH